ncbi:MAG: hypothetical protein OCC45_13340 [Desulfotalea sp.]
MYKYLITILMLIVPVSAHAEWVSLIPANMFDGIRTDLLTTVAGIVSCLLIVVGLGILYKVFR